MDFRRTLAHRPLLFLLLSLRLRRCVGHFGVLLDFWDLDGLGDGSGRHGGRDETRT